jgi:hypothetical protein
LSVLVTLSATNREDNLMTLPELEKLFSSHHIDFSNPGFYDLPEFLAVERTDNQFLDKYAEYVDRKHHAPEYLDRVRTFVPQLASFVHKALLREGRLGACIDVSGMVSRILDKEGIWSYAVAGGLTIEFPRESALSSSHFGVIGGESKIAAHMWIRVPPFAVLDITLSAQPWDSKRRQFLDGFVLAEESKPTRATVKQLVDMSEINRFRVFADREITMKDVKARIPHAFLFMERFHAFSVEFGPVSLAYAPTKISATEEKLEGMQVPELNGLSPIQLYRAFLDSMTK